MNSSRAARTAIAVACTLAVGLWMESEASAQTCNGDTLVSAGTISPSGTTQTVSGSVLAAQGNYYQFTASGTGGYSFSLCAARGGAASYDSYLCLLDAAFALIVSNDDFCGLSSQISRTLTAGTYYIGVSSFGSGFGTYTLAYVVDTTPPVAGTVNDGLSADITWQSSASTIQANWSGFSDAESGPLTYEYAIGTSPGATDIRAFSGVGAATSATASFLTLTGSVTYFVTVRATNGVGLQTTASSNGVSVFTMASSMPLPNATNGQAYSNVITASFGTGPYTWLQELGDLPAGLALAADGTVSGTPTVAGGFLFGCLVTDSLAATRRIAYSILVLPAGGGLVVTSGNPSVATSLPSVPLFSSYAFTATASGGQIPYVWRISAGSLPPGIILDSLTGALSGFPSRPGIFPFTLTATDSDDPSLAASALLSIQVTGTPGALFVTTVAALPPGHSNCPYALVLVASGGTGPYTWSVAPGVLPTSLVLDPAGVLSGTPDSIGSFPFTLTVTDAASVTANLAATLVVTQSLSALQITPATLPPAAQGVIYPMAFTATGGTPGYVWSISSGALPAGMSLDPVTGALAGSPGASGPFRFVVRAVDSGATPSSAGMLVELIVLRTASTGYVILTPSPLPPAAVGTPYRTAMAVLGGTNPHSWQVFSGALPPGLALNANTGEISGTPTAGGTFLFALSASSNAGILSSVRAYSQTVTGGGAGGGCGLLGMDAAALISLLLLLQRRRR